jgi:hypothetical protein
MKFSVPVLTQFLFLEPEVFTFHVICRRRLQVGLPHCLVTLNLNLSKSPKLNHPTDAVGFSKVARKREKKGFKKAANTRR